MNDAQKKETLLPFYDRMVLGILDGLKTQTRRAIKPQFDNVWGQGIPVKEGLALTHPNQKWQDAFGVDVDIIGKGGVGWTYLFCPYGKPGDHLLVKEALRGDGQPGNRRPGIVRYAADGEMVLPCVDCGSVFCECEGEDGFPGCVMDVLWEWKRPILPSIYMPKWAARIRLEITGLRAERLRDISEHDARAEGFSSKAEFLEEAARLLRLPGDANPYMWVVDFRPLDIRREG